MMRLRALGGGASRLMASVLLTACATAAPPADAQRAHHTASGFRNNYVERVDRSFAELLRWQWEALRDGLPPAPRTATPVTTPDLPLVYGYHAAHAKGQGTPAMTWIGHASTLVQAGGLNVLTDPIFSERASPVQIAGPKRAQPPGLALEQLPAIDVVVISHNHYDHLDRASVVALDYRARQSGARTLFLVPLGVGRLLNNLGVTDVVELDWWQSHTVRGVEFHLTPVQHWSARSLGDRNESLWGGWAVLAPDLHWYFSGDTGYSRDFIDTRDQFAARHGAAGGGGFDVALIPVGAYEPRWFMAAQHLDPAQAVQVHKDLGAKTSIGIHWGTFNLTDEPLDQPPRDLARARVAQGLDEQTFSLMKIGETRRLAARPR